ncbi:MAG TPA: hypothetical protein VGN57_08140 [Pirellulaceae bacterium]|jgi:sulfite reductase (ferredoxin)|nr:hypothetical protein [Pirellulaceae bacterium]
MTSGFDDPANGDEVDSGIERYLVRHGALGRRRLVGAIRSLTLARGDRVLIRTERGVEAAEVLLASHELPRSLAERPPAGEALEKLPTDAGSHSPDALGEDAIRERERIETLVQRLVEARAPETVIVDSELLWEGQDLIFYLAFAGSHELGRIAIEASTPTLRVRFETHDPPEDQAVERFDGAATPTAAPPRQDRLPREERFKETADPLVAGLPDALAKPGGKIDYENGWRLQHHGLYVQRRRERSADGKPGTERSSQEAMLRVRVPGGRLSAMQFVALADLAQTLGRGELRLTSRQTVQIQGLAIGSLGEVQRRLQDAGLSSWASCGDTVRNVVACPALPRRASWAAVFRKATQTLDQTLQPERSPYERLWHERSTGPSDAGDDPLFGRDLLPRKFKIALATPGDCCTDLLAHDLGFEATLAGENLAGWNVVLGGGFGYTPGRDDTSPRLADPLGWVPAEKIFDVAQAVVSWYRREGDRTDRRRARLKYLVADLGIDQVRETLEREFSLSFEPFRERAPGESRSPDDHLDSARQDDGRWRTGLHLAAGRLGGTNGAALKPLRELLARLRPAVALTPQQNLLFLDLPRDRLDELREALSEAGYADTPPSDNLRRGALACPALPTCGLALTEGERLLPQALTMLRSSLDRAGLAEQSLLFSVTGCPNGCARAYLAELAVVGVGPGRYAVRAGGAPSRDRLNQEIAVVATSRLCDAFDRIARWWAERGFPAEEFGETVARLGTTELAERLLEPG